MRADAASITAPEQPKRALPASDAKSIAVVAAALMRQSLAAEPVDRDLLSVSDVARALRCTDDTVRRIPRIDLPAHRVGKTNLYFREDLLRFVRMRPAGHGGTAERGDRDDRGACIGDVEAEKAKVAEFVRAVIDCDAIDAREPSNKRRAR